MFRNGHDPAIAELISIMMQYLRKSASNCRDARSTIVTNISARKKKTARSSRTSQAFSDLTTYCKVERLIAQNQKQGAKRILPGLTDIWTYRCLRCRKVPIYPFGGNLDWKPPKPTLANVSYLDFVLSDLSE
jgi:hypothetical protein